jgi:hypothetical protein
MKLYNNRNRSITGPDSIFYKSRLLRKRFTYSLLLSLILVFLYSCENANPSPSETGSQMITATVDKSSDEVNKVTQAPLAAPSAEDGEPIGITKNGITCTVNSATGFVTQVKSDQQTIDMDGIVIDVGYKSTFQFNQLGYTSFDTLATWELPIVWPKLKKLPAYQMKGITETENGFTVELQVDTLTVLYQYEMLEQALKVSAVITTSEQEDQLVNGVGFLVKGIQGFDKEKASVEFPGSTPVGRIELKKYPKYSAVSTDYASPIVQYHQDDRNVNVLFVDDQEKWTTASFCDEFDKPSSIFLTSVESMLKAGEELAVGTMYLQLLDHKEDPYLAVQNFWSALGYHVPSNGVKDGPVYSAHPYGTMDTNYFNRWTLQEYSNQLNRIAAMGFKNIWLLPIFQHTGDNVYEPIDQGVIDKRYGGEEGAKLFINKAHELNLRVLFDMVPHGPRPVYPFAKEHEDWVSKNQEGKNQIEWECVSFDYNNPGYYTYTLDLTARYARDFGLDGARIDCSMGGLSNWQPVNGLRPSSSGLAAGINITKATREGFLKGGVNPILLPENFHPIPIYAEYTDVFYDMPLFRAMNYLNHTDLSETEYVQRLERWLEAEHKTSVKGQAKLRFLGNHDTVTWTFDAERAQTFYGIDKAKALWSILSFIDGVPFIYQGDEDPATYKLSGENLEEFFTGILSAREEHLPADYEISYLYTGNPIFAFTRFDEKEKDTKLVLVNLSSVSNSYDLLEGKTKVLYHNGNYQLDHTMITLEPYSAVIIQKE